MTGEELLDSLELATARVHGRSATPTGEVAAPLAKGPGRVTAVVSASGGCGKTFLVTNVGYYLRTHHRRSTCLLDLDLQFGELASALRLRPQLSVVDLAGAGKVDPARGLDEHLVRHESGMAVLAAPDEPAEGGSVDSRGLARTITAARDRFEEVVIDTSSAFTDAGMVALGSADRVIAVATLDVPSIRNLGVMLAALDRRKLPSGQASLVLNKVEPGSGIDPAKIARCFRQGFAMTLPYGHEVNRSLNTGQPVLAHAPRSDVGRALADGLGRLALVNDDGEGQRGGGTRRRRFADRLGRA